MHVIFNIIYIYNNSIFRKGHDTEHTMSVNLDDRSLMSAAILTVSPTVGRASRTVCWVDWPLAEGEGVTRSRLALGIQNR